MARHRILAVTYDPHLGEMLRIATRPYYELIVADNEQVGYQHAHSVEPDLVVLDESSFHSAVDLCQTIRSIPGLVSIPIILIVASVPDDNSYEKYGATLVLPKALDSKELLERIHELLRLVTPSRKMLSLYDIQGFE